MIAPKRLLAALVALALTVWCAYRADGDELPKARKTAKADKLAAEKDADSELHRLEADIEAAHAEVGKLFAQKRYDEATKRLEELLPTANELYSIERYPSGHAEIAKIYVELGNVANAAGRPADCIQWYEKALVCYRRLYPPQQFPDGHVDIANTMVNIGIVRKLAGDIEHAQKDLEGAIVAARRLYAAAPKPEGGVAFVAALHFLAQILQGRGEYLRPVDLCREAADVCDRLYPPETHPRGHFQLAQSLSRLGFALKLAGDNYGAIPFLERSLRVYGQVFPRESFPNGHLDIAWTLWALGGAHYAHGEFDDAMQSYEQSLDMFERLFPNDQSPAGQDAIGKVILMMALTENSRGDYAAARSYYGRLLRIFSDENYPSGHPMIASTLQSIAVTYRVQKNYVEAVPYGERACEMLKRLDKSDQLADGDREIADATLHLATDMIQLGSFMRADELLSDAESRLRRTLAKKTEIDPLDPWITRSFTLLGSLLFARNQIDRAADALMLASKIQEAQTDEFYANASEAEAINLASKLTATRNALISVWPYTGRGFGDIYAVLWGRDGAIAHSFAERHRLLRAIADRDYIELLKQYADAKARLARITLATTEAGDARSKMNQDRLHALTELKERLERELTAEAPQVLSRRLRPRRPYRDFQSALRDGSVFIHFVRYGLVAPGPRPGRETVVPSYSSFVIAGTDNIKMIMLGPAEPIETAITNWRRAIFDDKPSDAAGELRRLFWEPIEKKLPPGTKTVYFTPDGPLTALPWAALPGKKPGSVLLEDYALALVPYGPFLLDQLTAPPRDDSADDVLLAVGGVAYDEQPIAPSEEGVLALRGEVGLDGPRVRWPDLPGAKREADALAELSGNRATTLLSGGEASTARVLAELPKARWAVFATHGFFADPKLRSALQLDESIFEKRDFLLGGERTTPVGRNPLLLSGLVLAGANLPRPNDEFGIPSGDGGILSAEQIAGLPLDKLELAVLSACDTGLGEVAGGEGVFGLQRAFHQAGAANVVASLWKIDDQATAALMRLFYYKLFRENKPPLAALREAQLAIYHHPEQIGPLASARAPDFGKKVKLVDSGKSKTSNGRAATRLWAGFVLSGAGR